MAKQIIDRLLRTGEGKKLKSYNSTLEVINSLEDSIEKLSDDEIKEAVLEIRASDDIDSSLPEMFALTREAAKRTLGQRHYDVQIIGGLVLNEGSIAEMKTGEGKTLTSTLAASFNALKGPVHVVTVNDYLARRDALWMKPIYDMLGISVAWLADSDGPAERRPKYKADILYGTNSEFGFDYLRDNMAETPDEKVQTDRAFAIVDEVDNILIDEARTPLIISGSAESASEEYQRFSQLAKKLKGIPAKAKLKSKGESQDTTTADYDYEYDEKHKTVSPTERGVGFAEKFLGIDHLFLPENGELVNHLIQSLKAESLYKKDRDYAVIDGEVRIIDEFTGRILEGRRWSEGLHQAIEAKEGLKVQEENQTMATITLQNYFRLYEKLSGMTGTALTEATEFLKIYKMEVVEIPTHREVVREDLDDLMFKTKEGKWTAVIDEIKSRNEKNQPVLVGTVSVEVSEMLSDKLTRQGIDHVVLNAKPEYAEREGEIIAGAGRPGAVTIATNMAGRGVDIRLGGDIEAHLEGLNTSEADQLKTKFKKDEETVRSAGGLFIIGTERHESRRIDNQLRGRSGRQGDPGGSRFYISAEDEVVRLFAGDRIYKILDRLGGEDDSPLESKMLTKTVENAQKKVEEQNFLIRKRVLEYDDVLSEQRRIIYRYRNSVLNGEDMSLTVKSELENLVDRLVDEYTPGDDVDDWDLGQMRDRVRMIWPTDLDLDIDPYKLDRESLKEDLRRDLIDYYHRCEEEVTPEYMREIERVILLSVIDSRWREHLYDMDYMREGIHLRGFAQIDPLVAYKNEGFQMFEQLIEDIWDEVASILFKVEVVSEEDVISEEEVPAAINPDRNKIGRNDPCPCGSGKKYKKCHGG